MGKAQKRKSQHKKHIIKLTGEQAEIFDKQMDLDKLLFENSEAAVIYRPSIEGEFNEQKIIGCYVPIVGKFRDGQPDFLDQQATWTIVVDIGRATNLAKSKPPGPASGHRTRMRCLPVLSRKDEMEYASAAMSYALQAIDAIKRQGKSPHD